MTALAQILEGARPRWWSAAACRTPEARRQIRARRADFFPDNGRSCGAARDICAGCAVQPECLRAALDDGPWLAGVFGGMTAGERRRALAGRR